MTDYEKLTCSNAWWRNLPFERKFYKVIDWLKSNGRDTTERHPNDLTSEEIKQIWQRETL